MQDATSQKIWFPSTKDKLGRLSQGFQGGVKAQDAMDFIFKDEVPSHKTVTYANFVCDYHPLKSEPFRVHMTVGVISDHKKHNSKFCAIDLKDFFLNTPTYG